MANIMDTIILDGSSAPEEYESLQLFNLDGTPDSE